MEMTHRPTRALTVTSLALNVLLSATTAILLVRSCRNRECAPALRSVEFKRSAEKGAHVVLKFSTPMPVEMLRRTVPDPFILTPPLVYAAVWDNPRTAFVFPDEPLVPGKEYQVRPSAKLRDGDGRRLADTRHVLVTEQLEVIEAGVPERTDVNCTRLSFRFNGPVSPVELAEHLQITEPSGAKRSARPQETQPMECPVLDVTHSAACKKLTVRVMPGLRAAGGDFGLPRERVFSIPLQRELVVGKLWPECDRNGVHLCFELSGHISHEEAETRIETTPRVDFRLKRQYHGGRYRLLGDFKPKTFYRVLFTKGLRATDNRRLAADVSRTVMTGDLQPILDFATCGPYLPNRRAPRLPVRVCNIDKLQLSAVRIYPNNFVAFWRDGEYSAHNNGRVVGEADVELSLPANSIELTELQLGDVLGDADSGIYVVRARANRPYWRTSARTVVWTDLALSFVRGRNDIRAWLVQLATNSPVPDAEVELWSQRNQLLARAQTDAAGLATLAWDHTASADEQPYLLLARQGEDVSMLGLDSDQQHDLSPFELPSRPPPLGAYEAFIYTERGICRPGERIALSTIVRDRNLEAAGGFPAELTISDPRGKTFHACTIQVSEDGFGTVSVPIPRHAATGHYHASLRVPGSAATEDVLGRCSFQVAHYVPDRLRTTLKTEREHYPLDSSLVAALSAEYYFGRPAGGCKATFRLLFEECSFAAHDAADFTFGNSERRWTKPRALRETAVLDAQGHASCQLDLPARLTPPAAVRLTVVGSVAEPGGRAVSTTTSATLHCYPYYIGVRRAWDPTEQPQSQLPFAWIAVDSSSKPVSPASQLHYELTRIIWRYALTEDSQGNYVRKWREERLKVTTGAIAVPPGETQGKFIAPCSEPGAYSLLVTDATGTVQTRLAFWYSEGDGNMTGLTSAAALDIRIDRETYCPQNRATLRFDAIAPGRALICTGVDSLLSVQTCEVRKGVNEVTVDIPNTPHGCVYTAITVVHNPDCPAEFPRRRFGLARLPIDQRRHKLQVDIHCADVVRPGATVSAELQLTSSGAPAGGFIQLFGVDEGILALTDYETPTPFPFFHGPRRCMLRFGDVFDQLFADMPDKTGTEAAIGGGDSVRLRNPVDVQQLAPAIVMLPLVSVPANGISRVDITLPEHTGALRLVAVAFNRRQLGSTERLLRMRRPISVQLTAPRALAPADEFEVTAQLFNHEIDETRAHIALSSTGPAQLLSSPALSVQMPKQQQACIRFRFRAATDEAGPVRLAVVLRQGGAEHRAEAVLSVRPATPPAFHCGYKLIPPLSTATVTLPGPWLAGTADTHVKASTSMQVEIAGALTWLRRYPYGCLEQTVSAAIPLFFLPDAVELPDAEGKPGKDIFAWALRMAIQRLYLMELPTGGFATWPGGDGIWRSGSVYAAHFLALAREHGFAVDRATWRRTLAFLRACAKHSDRELSAEDRAYALYVLAHTETPETEFAASLLEDEETSPLSRFLAAASLLKAGRARTGADALNRLVDTAYLDGTCGWDMDSPARRVAIALNALIDVAPDSPEALRLLMLLRKMRRETGHWGTTQNNALAVLAIGRWAHVHPLQKGSRGRIELDGQPPIAVSHGNDASIKALSPGTPIRLTALGPGPLYCAWHSSGVPLRPLAAPLSRGITINRSYLDEAGEAALSFQQGDLLRTRITVRSRHSRSNVVIVDPLPGGFEIEDGALRTRWAGPSHRDNISVDFVEKLDDRLLLFCSLPAEHTKSFTYTVRAVTRGTFTTPRITAEAMYAPDIRGESGGDSTVVVK